MAVSSYNNRRSLETTSGLTRRSTNMFQKETFYGKKSDNFRATALALEDTGSKKHNNMKSQMENNTRMKRGTLLLGKRRSSQHLFIPNESQSKKSHNPTAALTPNLTQE